MDKSYDEQCSRDSQHKEESYSSPKGKDKHDRKAPQRYGFEDIISFVLVANRGDPLCFRMLPKEVK